MLKKNEIYRAAVTGFTSEGLGVCRVEGCAVFVPNAAPGEEYDLRIEHVGKNAAHGKIVHIITKSTARVNRGCPYAKQCGGCDFWHLTYEAECEIKAQRVLDALNRLGGQALNAVPITGAKTCEGYRNKAQFPVAPLGAGLTAGFSEKGPTRSSRSIAAASSRSAPTGPKRWSCAGRGTIASRPTTKRHPPVCCATFSSATPPRQGRCWSASSSTARDCRGKRS